MRYEGAEAFGSVSISSGTVDSTPYQDSPVFTATRQIEDELTALNEDIGVLAKRLNPLLRPSEPRPEGGDKIAMVGRAASDHAEALQRHVEFASTLRDRIGDLLNRLEV